MNTCHTNRRTAEAEVWVSNMPTSTCVWRNPFLYVVFSLPAFHLRKAVYIVRRKAANFTGTQCITGFTFMCVMRNFNTDIFRTKFRILTIQQPSYPVSGTNCSSAVVVTPAIGLSSFLTITSVTLFVFHFKPYDSAKHTFSEPENRDKLVYWNLTSMGRWKGRQVVWAGGAVWRLANTL